MATEPIIQYYWLRVNFDAGEREVTVALDYILSLNLNMDTYDTGSLIIGM